MHGQVKKNKQAKDLGRQQRHRTENRSVERLVAGLNGVHEVSKRSLTPGTVVQARVPYQESNESKVRPALVLDCRGDVVVLRPISTKESFTRRHGGGDEVVLNGQRCWVVNEAIELDRMEILQVTAQRYDELAFATAA